VSTLSWFFPLNFLLVGSIRSKRLVSISLRISKAHNPAGTPKTQLNQWMQFLHLMCFQSYNRGQESWDSVLKWVASANKTTHTPPIHSESGCLLLLTGTSNSGTTLHRWGEGGQKDSLRQNVATNFVTDCSLNGNGTNVKGTVIDSESTIFQAFLACKCLRCSL